MNLISGREAAILLGISPTTMSGWVASGRLIPVGTISNGRTFLFDRVYIESLAAARRAEAEAKETAAVSTAA